MSKLRVAICGAGIGAEHLSGYLANPALYEVVCIADPDKDRAQPLMSLANCRHVATAEDAVQCDDVDVLDICLPPGLHKDAILAGLAAGKHVICEKPLVPSLADVDEILAVAATASTQVVPVFQYRFGNGLTQLQALIDQGIAGTPLVATIETHWKRDADYYSVPWRGKWATELGGVIVGHAIHAHDLLVQVLGPIADVQARLATRVNPIEVEDCAAVVLGMRSGALVTSSVTLGSAVDQSRLRFCFSNLSAESSLSAYNPGTTPWRFMAHDSSVQEQVDAIVAQHNPHAEGFARQFELAHAALTGNSPLPVTLADARASLELITAIYQSSRDAAKVALPLGPDAAAYHGWLPH